MTARTAGILALLAAGASLLGACSTLGGTVRGQFACRAPAGSCAPTALIDAAATGTGADTGPGMAVGAVASDVSGLRTGMPGARTDHRTLRIVLSARRDEAGRMHDARVVHVPLPEPPGEGWRQPASTGDLLRAIARAVDPAAPAETAGSAIPQSPLPDRLFSPSQPGAAISGDGAPEPGASGEAPLPDRVPLFLTDPPAAPVPGDSP